MTCNIGKYERIIRGIVGIVVIAWGVMEQNWLGAIGLIPLGTALIGWCPPYAILGINTGCKTKND
ncbi:MAG: DUF2892 domain-containing protein [Sulfurovum sp.]|uniref:YgaP family membrane protein n=1 Tax=Sulfurovum sp. TaxID=1969726 RepID=UPI0028681306|nr:DUF2892 domain-containing protein [Sulfurovum sp.]MCO4846250.1 DUF2892 domain-containing protein [Sulfurovum sp.]